MRNLFAVMTDKKNPFSLIVVNLCSKVFIVCALLFTLLPGYTSSNQYDASPSPSLQKKPRHVAIIMDGNGRWGKKAIGDRSYGHKNAKKAVNEVITGCLEQGISYLTLYAFSTENWSRPAQEIDTIFRVITEGIAENIHLFSKYNIKFRVVGETKGIPDFCWEKLNEAITLTKDNTKLHLTVAINYGGQAEVVAASEAIVKDALHKIVHEFLNKGFDSNSRFEHFIKFAHDYHIKITPTIYKEYLNTRQLPDIDLLIRTGGQKRISNFLPWQSAYSELYFTDLYWPAFKKEDLMEALTFFQKQQRNFGGVV
ncbi:poly-cis-decaprenylcistransferase [Cardinium endosymbiont of Sogatella furcifera]|uniref:polyprenyl diphosphate synthase n=1 Tax=Cardinium endosymbiont of Sogatella furcifera TaxID=650378 RepID=UPI000E0D2821|nr:polyprenyl diphosphate synthase [Cardinium endosymbiont of Sogatella furcifera]AXI24146.1 poly-cis-decaprenylcistransferase [Cardinium endosymbiont of Sogatella furcifera]